MTEEQPPKVEWRVIVEHDRDAVFFVFVNKKYDWTIRAPMPSEACAHSVARDLGQTVSWGMISLDQPSEVFLRYILAVVGAWQSRHKDDAAESVLRQ